MGRGWRIHKLLAAIFEGIHISLGTCVWGYTYHCDTFRYSSDGKLWLVTVEWGLVPRNDARRPYDKLHEGASNWQQVLGRNTCE